MIAVTKGLLVILLFVLPCTFTQAQQELKVDLDTRYQIMEGFGASDAWRTQFVGKNWPMHKREKIADLLFSQEYDEKGNPKGIGLSLWRFYIGAGSTEQGDNSDIKNEWRRVGCFLNENGQYDWTKQPGQQWFLQAAKARGVEKFLAFTIAPPVFWSTNQKAYSIKEDPHMNIQEDKMDDYADFLAEVISYFQNQKDIHFDYLSPVNEPQWDWSNGNQEGTPATNEEIFSFTKHLSESLQKRNLHTQIVIGEAGSIAYLTGEQDKPLQGNQVEAFFAEESPLYIGDLPNVKKTISGHSYFTTWPVEKLVTSREALDEKRRSVDKELGYWQSEFCILEKTDEIGSGHERDLGMNTALYVARVIHADIVLAQASSWQWWTALTTFDYKDGLIYLDTGNEHDLYNRTAMKNDGKFHGSRLLWTFGNFSQFIRPGMRRVGTNFTHEVTQENVLVSAYHDESHGKVVVLLINQSSMEKTIVIHDKNIQYDRKYITSELHTLDYEKVEGNKLTIPARSVTTLTGKVKTN